MSFRNLFKPENLILAVLFSGSEVYGQGIANKIEKESNGEISINCGTLYTLLKKLENDELVKSTWEGENERKGTRRKYYKITEKGKKLVLNSNNFYNNLLEIPREEEDKKSLDILESIRTSRAKSLRETIKKKNIIRFADQLNEEERILFNNYLSFKITHMSQDEFDHWLAGYVSSSSLGEFNSISIPLWLEGYAKYKSAKNKSSYDNEIIPLISLLTKINKIIRDN